MNPLVATYRIQLNRDFTFQHLIEQIPYLNQLGVSHLYLSPCLQAASGSMHGYDVVDTSRINSELGGQKGFAELCTKARQAGLGLVLDIVPNHMAAIAEENPWWWHVLEHGLMSPYAGYFDLYCYNPAHFRRNEMQKFPQPILLPILPDHIGRVIDQGLIRFEWFQGDLIVRCNGTALPLSAQARADILSSSAHERLQDLGQQWQKLSESTAKNGPLAASPDPDAQRYFDQIDKLKTTLVQVCQQNAEVLDQLTTRLQELAAESAQMLALLNQQHYRLAFWPIAREEINYRRFFDISGLIALRADQNQVLTDTHALIFEMVEKGEVQGLRIDHCDGLRLPRQYFETLRQACPDSWIIAEKILHEDESLPRTWPIDGTTGYEFLSNVSQLLLNANGLQRLARIYHDLCPQFGDYQQVVKDAKRQRLSIELRAEQLRLTRLLQSLCWSNPSLRDYSEHDLFRFLQELIASMPVYRTYFVPGDGTPEEHAHDSVILKKALHAARIQYTGIDPVLCEFLFLLAHDPQTLFSENSNAPLAIGRWRSFSEQQSLVWQAQAEELILLLQQVSSAVMAKGQEDTAFYRYNRLVALNEVGSPPDALGLSVAEFHQQCRTRQKYAPKAMSLTASHDTKRSEDVRARLFVLSEIPEIWEQQVRSWIAHNATHKEQGLPDFNTEYHLYQNLVGSWPISAERFQEYMLKAVREAKQETSWLHPHDRYERILQAFIEKMFEDREFITKLDHFVTEIAPAGCLNSLSQVLLKLMAPGIPDIYQGSELWDFSLVDPDNRRPVDYEKRHRLLEQLPDGRNEFELHWILENFAEGAPKAWLIKQGLQVRRSFPEIFQNPESNYQPLVTRGDKAQQIIAFMRGLDVIALAARWQYGMSDTDWQKTEIELPSPGTWQNWLDGQIYTSGDHCCHCIWQNFPVAILCRTSSDTASPHHPSAQGDPP